MILCSCKITDENADGCTLVTPKPYQVELGTALDPARDLQRLHSLIMNNLQTLEAYGSASLNTASSTQMAGGGHPTDEFCLVSCRRTLQSMIEISLGLEQIHRKYKSMLARDLKYGSRQSPIGDDNYLHTIRGPGICGLGQQHHHHQQQNQQQQHQQSNLGQQQLQISPSFFHRNSHLRSSDN